MLVRAERAPGAVTIRGWGSSNDANHMTGPAADGSGLARAMQAALSVAGLRPAQIDYTNAHGTGTVYNDAMESRAIHSVFGEGAPPCSALKGMFGHTLGAAGVVETIACVLALRERFLPGTVRLNVSADGMPASLVKEARPAARLDHILKVNSGFGGVNAALVLAHG